MARLRALRAFPLAALLLAQLTEVAELTGQARLATTLVYECTRLAGASGMACGAFAGQLRDSVLEPRSRRRLCSFHRNRCRRRDGCRRECSQLLLRLSRNWLHEDAWRRRHRLACAVRLGSSGDKDLAREGACNAVGQQRVLMRQSLLSGEVARGHANDGCRCEAPYLTQEGAAIPRAEQVRQRWRQAMGAPGIASRRTLLPDKLLHRLRRSQALLALRRGALRPSEPRNRLGGSEPAQALMAFPLGAEQHAARAVLLASGRAAVDPVPHRQGRPRRDAAVHLQVDSRCLALQLRQALRCQLLLARRLRLRDRHRESPDGLGVAGGSATVSL
mmetsp:Transcript_75166/g.193831  ORF Transcript_75166/g.193831 Transcript_75166/m.193831 type:complete len:332 (-) Transcript_75166:8-1003(-)